MCCYYKLINKMSFFKRKKEEPEDNFDIGDKELENPKLPNLPTLKAPELSPSSLPDLSKEKKSLEINSLPSLPDNSFGEKLSQDTIKSVVGEKEDIKHEEVSEKKSPPVVNHSIKEGSESKDEKPIFVKLDKFEEGIEVFKKTKIKVSEIESTLANIKQIREEEKQQLTYWEEELQKIKNNISLIEKNIFSKIK